MIPLWGSKFPWLPCSSEQQEASRTAAAAQASVFVILRVSNTDFVQGAARGLPGPMACSTVFDIFVKLRGNCGTYKKCAFFKFCLERRDCSQLEISSKGGEYAMLQHCA